MTTDPQASRPWMPASYGVPTEGSGLPWSWVTQRLERSPNYWVVSVRPDGRTHAAPVWGVWVDGAVWFGSGPDSVKARNLAANPAAVIHLESGDEAVICYGEVAGRRVDGDLLARIDAAYAAKYTNPETGDPFTLSGGTETEVAVYRMAPHRVLAWLESDFATSPTAFDL